MKIQLIVVTGSLASIFASGLFLGADSIGRIFCAIGLICVGMLIGQDWDQRK